MNRTCCMLALMFATWMTWLLCIADEPVDNAKLRRLHQKAKSGETLTPEEQAYYERGKAARKSGNDSRKKQPVEKTRKESNDPHQFVPLCDMTADQKYKGEEGGLYGGGANVLPSAQRAAAEKWAARIQPLDADGKPSPQGKIVLVTHGMSNTTNESEQFIKIANADPRKNPAVLLVDGAQGGIDSRQWVSGKPNRQGVNPWERLDQRIKAAGVSPQQVQVVWMKHAIARVSQFGDFPKHAQQLQSDTAQIARLLKQRFPNLQIIYMSSRSYGGYATTELNPEPYAYESAFAVRWLIQEQQRGEPGLSYQDGKAPLLLWGPYLWSDGERGRKADDLAYVRNDFRDDGTHPSDSGRQKIASQLLKFFTTDSTASIWFCQP